MARSSGAGEDGTNRNSYYFQFLEDDQTRDKTLSLVRSPEDDSPSDLRDVWLAWHITLYGCTFAPTIALILSTMYSWDADTGEGKTKSPSSAPPTFRTQLSALLRSAFFRRVILKVVFPWTIAIVAVSLARVFMGIQSWTRAGERRQKTGA